MFNNRHMKNKPAFLIQFCLFASLPFSRGVIFHQRERRSLWLAPYKVTYINPKLSQINAVWKNALKEDRSLSPSRNGL